MKRGAADASPEALAAALLLTILVAGATAHAQVAPLPDRVSFASADGHATLVGYVFKPTGPHAARTPAVVMMHGRAGAYSSLANGNYSSATLSKRH
jgi:predicted alpha/beta-fold hydrolase